MADRARGLTTRASLCKYTCKAAAAAKAGGAMEPKGGQEARSRAGRRYAVCQDNLWPSGHLYSLRLDAVLTF